MRFPLAAIPVLVFTLPLSAQSLPDTKPLTTEGDLAAQMVAGIDKYLMREITASVAKRKVYWKLDTSSPEAYAKSIQPNRARLAHILGVVDPLVRPFDLEYVATRSSEALVAEREDYRVYAVRWPVFEGVHGEGLLLIPKGKPKASVVALPDADWTPEMFAGLAPGLPPDYQFARRLAENGCRVLVPTLIDRKTCYSGNPKIGRMTNQPHREYVYRMAFEMGRHVIGYEIQKVLATLPHFLKNNDAMLLGIVGYGEGGLLAFYCGALDPRIKRTVVSGYFGPQEDVWRKPIYRNIWGLLREFGDAEVGLLYERDRSLAIEYRPPPRMDDAQAGQPPPKGTTPGKLEPQSVEAVKAEWDRMQDLGIPATHTWIPNATGEAVDPLLEFGDRQDKKKSADRPGKSKRPEPPLTDRRKNFDPAARQKRQFDQLVNFTQTLMRDSEQRRRETFWAKLDTSTLEKYQASTARFRDQFWEEVIGKLPAPTAPMNPRSRLAYDEPKWKGYEVALDLYPDVFAYGILLVPKDLKPGERRPVVVCQHGLEGRPQDVVNPKKKTPPYNCFGAQLADRGYIVYAPQNPYIGQDKFRVLQRKANPLGLSIFSFIVRQHERTLDWLAGLPFVDAERMAFYGLSYGGKTAMRVPALLPRYCLSICSGDFNEWIWKNVSVDFPASYVFSGEYEMFEFNLGNTFGYAEMAALIAPRPFMVERGHNDGVGIDEWVAYEYAKVRRLYARLGSADRTAIEFFNHGHEINGQGTFAFLDKHLRWH